MVEYSNDDVATYYFVVNEISDTNKVIQAWTDNKYLAKSYMKFHNCSKFTLKKISQRVGDIKRSIEDEEYHLELGISQIYTRSEKDPSKGKWISVPVTGSEMYFINDESNTFFSSRIPYSYIEDVICHLKYKYQKALDDILLSSVIRKVIYQRGDKYIDNIELDGLMILLRSFPDNFG